MRYLNNSRYNYLALPQGRAPGFDPNHIVFQSEPKGILSLVANNGGNNSLVSPLSPSTFPTVVNGTMTSTIVSNLGCVLKFPAQQSTVTNLQYAAPATGAYTSSLCGAIFMTPPGFTGLGFTAVVQIGPSNTSCNTLIRYTNGVLRYQYRGVATSNVSSGFPAVSNNTPYFVATYAQSTTVVNFLQLNLNNGQLLSTTITSGTTGQFTTGNWCIGGDSAAGDNSECIYAAVMIAINANTSLAAMLRWAEDPWSFWYPLRKHSYGRGHSMQINLVRPQYRGWKPRT